jgi:subtilisin family serine protease
MKIKDAAIFRRRGSVVLASLAAVVGLSVAIPPATTASSDAASGKTAGQPDGVDPTQITLDGVSPGTHVLTLITGDRVTLSGVGGGHFSVDVQPATRPDGEQPTFAAESGPDGVYVIPSDAAPAVASGGLDRELFDVEYLAEHGYFNGQMTRLPVIARYPTSREPTQVNNSAEALPASTLTRGLASIHGAALSVSRSNASAFWASINPNAAGSGGSTAAAMTAPSTLDRGLTGLWLDAKVHVTLDESVPLIGAPQAWAGGFDGSGVKVAVLDTGIDTSHPDFAGKIVDSQSFVPGVDSVNDGHGHGTHVASTVAGTGAAEDGKYKGVAPGAQLVIGKVLDDSGSGQASWIIDGMEWAAHSGAKVVSMSLGDAPTDGFDPMSVAVNLLTVQTGTLFVIAAGNAGPDASTVGAPGAANFALTVAATDKSDQLADFSSRGPRIDGALKPDIAAPGVDIVAARAKGTPIGDRDPVDDFYARLSGTSMATPHVAGAAAILAEEYPEWKAPQLKAALMSTAKDDGYSVYEQGAGRVDVARAFSQKVYATIPSGGWTPSVDFGRLSSGPNDTISKPVSYTNLTDQPVTLNLTPQLRTTGGEPAPDGTLTVDATTLDVPAGGTATAFVTLDPTRLDFGQYTGTITATADNVHLTTPVGATRLAKLTIHIVNDRPFSVRPIFVVPTELEDGQTATATAASVATGEFSSAARDAAAIDQPGTAGVFELTATGLVLPGTYSVSTGAIWLGDDHIFNSATLVNPQVSVTDGTEVTLDIRQAKQITFTTPRPTGPAWTVTTALEGSLPDGSLWSSWNVGFAPHRRLWALPTERVTEGIFRYATKVTLSNPQLTMTVDQPERRQLNVLTRAYADRGLTFGNTTNGFVPWTEDQELRLVDAGFGDPDDIAGLDLHGKLALLRYGDSDPNGFPRCNPFQDRIENVRQAGAAGIVFFPVSPDGACQVPAIPVRLDSRGGPRTIELPEAWLTPADGQRLAEQAANGTVVIDLNADPDIRYTYELNQYEEQEISDSLDYTYTKRDLAQIDTAFHAIDPAILGGQSAWHAFKPRQNISFAVTFGYAVPQARPVYVGPLASDAVWSENSQDISRDIDPETGVNLPLDHVSRLWVFDQPIRTSEQRHTVPIAPGVKPSVDAAHAARPDLFWAACSLCREGDIFWPFHYDIATGQDVSMGGSLSAHLFREDGEEIPQNPGAVGSFTLPELPGTYRLVEDRAFTNGSRVGTTWTFTSPGTPQQSTTQPGYSCIDSGTSSGPCQPEPAIFLSYDLGDSLGLDNTVASPGQSKIQVRAYHAQSTVEMPPLAGLKLWASTDDGAHWKQLQVRQLTDGSDATFEATVVYPKFADTTGAVSLKAEAWDTTGNRIEQTLTRAYNLRNGQ